MALQPTTLLTMLFALLGFSLAATEAWGQRGRNRQEYPIRTFATTEVEGEFGMEYHYFGDTIRRTESGRTRFSNHYFQQYLLGRARGYGYHPEFIDYTAELKMGLSQQWLSHSSPFTDSRSSRDLDTLLGYNLRAEILKEKPVSGTVTASRDERILMGLFLDRHRTVTDSYSGTVRWRTRTTNMDLTARRTETETFGFRSSGTTVSDMLLYNFRHNLGRRVRTDVRYRVQSFDRRFTARTHTGDVTRETDQLSHDLNVSNRIAFDELQRMVLRTNFRLHDRQGTRDLRTYFFQQRLQYRADRLFRPYATYSILRNEYDFGSSETYRGEAGFDGDLFESLAYHFNLHAQRTDRDGFTEDRYGPTLRLNYRKLTPWGLLTAGYAHTLDQVKRSGMAATSQIIGESIVVRVAFPTFLSEPNVIIPSIRVTATDGVTVFQEGFDYRVVTVGGRTGIQVLPGGLLADGTRVLVDYQVELVGDESYIADDQSYHVRHDFDRVARGLSLYARRNTFRARNVDSPVELNVVEYTNQMVGLRQEWRDFAYTSEYEMYDDDLGGYDQWRNQLEGNHDLGRRVRWGWRAGVTRTDFDTDFGDRRDRRETFTFAGTHLNGPIARDGYWRLEGRVLKHTGRTERTTSGIVGRIGYQFRRLNVEGGARVEHHDVADTRQDRLQLFVATRLGLGRRVFSGRQR